ncbi:MAG: hypothetical protein NTY77_02010 [Elusimicrobia bacterium]|nr:hypothetical protein [Elusimicrobiota bacterium]
MRTLLASVLTAAMVHGSVAQAAMYAGSAPQPIERLPGAAPLSSKTITDPIQKNFQPVPLPGGQVKKRLPSTTALPATPDVTALQPEEGFAPNAAQTSADAVLSDMGKGLTFAGGQTALGGYYDGDQTRRDGSGPVLGEETSESGTGLQASTTPGQKKASAVPAPQSPSEHAAVIPVIVVVAIVAAVVAAGTGVYLWLRGKSKNDTWQNSKSNQDIIALEKARRDNDPAALEKIKTEARGRQQRMDERVANAQSAGSRSVTLSDGKSLPVQSAQTYAAFDGLVAARSEINENAVSQDPAKRVGGQPPAVWQSQLTGLESQAKQTESEGALALSLKSMRSEIGREDAAAGRYEKDISRFDASVPGLFGGRLKEMTKRAQTDLNEFKSAEIAPEKALLEKTNGAMRGRVSDRLTAKDTEYQGHLAHLDTLNQAADGTLKSAVEMAQQVDKDMADMSSHEHNRAFNLLLASQNESVLVDDYDGQGRKTGSHYEDHSATFKALAASEGAEARASAASAQAGVKALNTIIPLLHKDPVLKAEGLTFALPANSGKGPNSSGSVFFDFWLPASWNFFGTMFSESQAGQARASFAPIKGSLESVMAEVNSRRSGERAWTDKRIDGVLDGQMKQAAGQK